jgi:peptidoglycan LD-endopeptidase CwlK
VSADERYRLHKLAGCCEDLTHRITKVLTAMDALGWPMIVTDGHRSVDDQRRLYALGRTVPGKIVTHCDGILKPSNHQSGKACDCTFLDPETGQPSWDARLPWKTYGACLETVGLKWGGHWAGLHDLPHAELL